MRLAVVTQVLVFDICQAASWDDSGSPVVVFFLPSFQSTVLTVTMDIVSDCHTVS